MATETTNYKLKKPAQGDYYNVDDFNGNFDIVDEELKKHSDSIAGLTTDIKASADNVTAMISMVRLGKYVSEDGIIDVSFDLSDINVSDYSLLKILICNVTSSEGAGNTFLRFNDDSGENYGAMQESGLTRIAILGSSIHTQADGANVDIQCGVNRIHTILRYFYYLSSSLLPSTTETYGSYLGCGGSGLQSIQVYSDGNAGEGVEVILYGIRK